VIEERMNAAKVGRVVVLMGRIGNQRGRGIVVHMYRPLFFFVSSSSWVLVAVAVAVAVEVGGYARLMQL
jgi:hypothetical protein